MARLTTATVRGIAVLDRAWAPTRIYETDTVVQEADPRPGTMFTSEDYARLVPQIVGSQTVDIGLVAILASEHQSLIRVAKNLGVSKIAVMPDFIASKSLIGQFPDRSICLEVGRGLRSDKLAETLAQRIV